MAASTQAPLSYVLAQITHPTLTKGAVLRTFLFFFVSRSTITYSPCAQFGAELSTKQLQTAAPAEFVRQTESPPHQGLQNELVPHSTTPAPPRRSGEDDCRLNSLEFTDKRETHPLNLPGLAEAETSAGKSRDDGHPPIYRPNNKSSCCKGPLEKEKERERECAKERQRRGDCGYIGRVKNLLQC